MPTIRCIDKSDTKDTLPQMLTARESRRLAEVCAEIDMLDHRINSAHALGDSSSRQGISTTFNDVLGWSKRRDELRAIRDALEARQAGETAKQPGVNVMFYRAD